MPRNVLPVLQYVLCLRIWVLMSILNVKLSEKRALEIGMMSGNSMSCVCCYNKLCATEQNAVFFFYL